MEAGQLTAGAARGLGELDVLDPTVDDGLSTSDLGAEVAAAPPFALGRPPARIAPAARRRDALYRRLLAGADVLSLAIALLVGVVVLNGLALTPFVVLTLPALVVIAKALDLYDRDQHLIHKTTLDELPKLFHLAVLVGFGVFLLEGGIATGQMTPIGLLVFTATLFLGLGTSRSIARQIACRLAPPERCVVIGDQELADELAQKVVANGGTTVEFVGRLDEPSANGDDRAHGIGRFLVENEIHRVVLAPGAEHRRDMLALVGEIKSFGVKISVLPSVSQAGGTSFELDRIAGITLLGMRGFEFTRSSKILKRAMDIAISGTALVFLAPLMAIVAVAIKLTSRGPVYYRQTRVGRHGEHFEMLKFRTMLENSDALRAELEHLNEAGGGLFKIADDPRITPVGRFLRSLSVDELPQLVNVLRGEMSLVGPRPLVVEEDRLIHGWHRARLALTPGMTGYWQVLGSARIPLDEMVKLDYAYVQNWSAWHDVQLLLRTIPFVAARRGL